MLGLGTIGQFAIGQAAATNAEVITIDKWYQPLSIPPRFPIGLMASQQQFAALSDPIPLVSFGWFETLSEPAVKTLPGLRASQQQFLALQPAPSPFVPTGWYVPLSEPPRFPIGLRPSQQQFTTEDTAVIPVSKISPWYVPLSEPPRFKIGLKAAQQQFLAAPPRLLPTPNITGIMNAIETGDTFLGGGRIFNRPNSAEMGISQPVSPAAEMGVAQPSAGGLTAKMTISIL